jgi:hypothetical protein
MKLLILILVLTLNLQPLQAGTCDMDMEKNQETSHHMDQTGHMRHMDRTAQMDHTAQNQHDCCDSGGSDSGNSCDDQMQCGFCFANVSALPSLNRFASAWTQQYSLDFSAQLILPSHSSPLFRPPIS